MQSGIDGMTTSITERKNAVNGIRASIPRNLPISAILNTIIGIVFGLFTQPFFTKLIMKSVFGKKCSKGVKYMSSCGMSVHIAGTLVKIGES